MTIFKESPFTIIFQLLGKKWTIEIITELFKGKMRFSDLLEIDSNLTSKVLSDRLKELYANRVIEKIVINMMPLKIKYQLTENGRLLNRILLEGALYSCAFFPERIFQSQHQNTDELISDLGGILQLDSINYSEIKKVYFDSKLNFFLNK